MANKLFLATASLIAAIFVATASASFVTSAVQQYIAAVQQPVQ